MTKGLRVLRAVEGTIWAIQPGKLRELAPVVAHRVKGGLRLSASEVAAIQRPRSALTRAGAVAVLPLHGVIAQRMDLMTAISGGTSTEAFARDFDAALRDSAIGSIVLDVDSPGGAVAGVPELAERIYNARGVKPIIAVLNPLGASAAYYIASAADEVVITRMGFGGALGTIMVRADLSAADEEEGIRYHFITGGQFKAEGHPHFPCSEEELEAIQRNVDAAYQMFVSDVAKHRGITTEQVEERYGQGRVMLGQLAVDAGLADRVATLDEVVRELSAGAKPQRRSGARAAAEAPALAASAGTVTIEGGPIPQDVFAGILNAGARVILSTTAGTIALQQTPDADGAAPEAEVPDPAPTPAPEARSEAMSVENGTAAPDVGAVNAERKRVNDLHALAGEHKQFVSAELLAKWVEGGVSVGAASEEILKAQREARAAQPTVRAGEPRAAKDPAKGFGSPRDFVLAVIENSGLRDRSDVQDERLRPLAMFDKDDKMAASELAFLLPAAFTPAQLRAAAGADEQGTYADPYGGFAVPTTRLPGIKTIPFEGDPTAGRTTNVPMATPQIEINARTDKDHSTSVSGGLIVTRKPETKAATASRMATELVTMKATSLFGLSYITEELLTDSPVSFAALVAQGFSDQFPAHILNEKLNGKGGFEMEGILNAACRVTVAKETGQAADTIVFDNVSKMAARMWGFGNSIWVANHDTRPQLCKIALPIGTGGVAMYQPSEREGFPDMLWGRPVFYTEFAAKLGDVGDLILWNPTQYLEGLYQPLQSAESVHVRFENHERVLKFWLRNAGASWWRSALTPAKSAETLSPIVLLAAR
jgi:HK97 family phage major capsid protein